MKNCTVELRPEVPSAEGRSNRMESKTIDTDHDRTVAGDRRPLDRNVYALAAVSFFTDVATEMIYPLLPLFLSTALGASASFVSAIEGAAESFASLLKLATGWWSD